MSDFRFIAKDGRPGPVANVGDRFRCGEDVFYVLRFDISLGAGFTARVHWSRPGEVVWRTRTVPVDPSPDNPVQGPPVTVAEVLASFEPEPESGIEQYIAADMRRVLSCKDVVPLVIDDGDTAVSPDYVVQARPAQQLTAMLHDIERLKLSFAGLADSFAQYAAAFEQVRKQLEALEAGAPKEPDKGAGLLTQRPYDHRLGNFRGLMS